ncbi:MAG: hypothetical protein U1E61_04505 [Bradyrhizobium sp.]
MTNAHRAQGTTAFRAFSSEVDTGSREENASNQKSRASVLIQSEPKMLWLIVPPPDALHLSLPEK